ncbi:sigma-E processing peptidase SpoIIGA [Virgibacillus sp. W0430]|uniref:sigma-E processing peptidase SpoIIGA n=1 Tax=Virgibacillus sp. W0430 TaxID=3391580 RepID=UPI003F472EE1
MAIYLDVVWLLNFLIDLLLLLLTQALAKVHTKKVRVLFGAFVASLLVPISIYFPASFFTTFFGKVLYSIVIIFCTFPFVSLYQVIKLLFLFYFISFSIGGGLFGIHFLLQDTFQRSGNGFLTFHGGYGDPVSWFLVIIGFPFVWLFTKNRMDKHAVEKIRYDQLYPVTIQMKGNSYTTTGYIDSGNQLVDPLTKKPVIVCDKSFLLHWFTEQEWKLLELAFQSFDFSHVPGKWENDLHFVPYQGVDGSSQFLLALKPDKLIIEYGEKAITTKHCLIGIQFAQLTHDDSYHCLLQPQIIKLAA